jgi:hypothetical protein
VGVSGERRRVGSGWTIEPQNAIAVRTPRADLDGKASIAVASPQPFEKFPRRQDAQETVDTAEERDPVFVDSR